ncbi:MAG: acyl-CoA dehydrogenase family protein [Actinobacteria bacterium]|nr:acyl-CoA dehydrogenase family protein [Actinomycetota bacterium]
MDPPLTSAHVAFRDEARAWLADHVPDLPPPGSPEAFEQHVSWERELHEAGFQALHWPEEYGGRGADVVTQAIFEEEYVRADGPDRVTVLGTNLLAPTLFAHGTDAQRQRWLPDILAARTIWSQGFSEPDAGSDLASLRTRAERDGDDLVVNGQKIWTSYGAYADWIFALVRTSNFSAPRADSTPDGPTKHAGITFVAIDLRSDGVEVRPIIQLDGHAGFSEVFFTDVRVPIDQVIGEIDDGWPVAMTTLAAERDAPAAPPARYERDLRDLIDIARAVGLDTDDVVRDRIAGLHVRVECYRHQAAATVATLAAGGSLGDGASVTKLLWSELERDLYAFGLELLGAHGEVLDDRAPLRDVAGWHSRYWYARAATIYAGTSEIQRNILARRVLALPKA